MTQAALTDEIALRIALAARAVPDTDPARLIKVLDDAIGLPPTAKKLSTLQFKVFKNALDGELSDVDPDALKEAVAILKGEQQPGDDPAPSVDPYVDGDMPDSIRVACASNSGELLDGHFGSAKRFLVYQVSALENRLIDVRDTDDTEADDKNAYRAAVIADCQVLYVASIGGPAAAKVVKADVHPIKDPKGGSARERMHALQQVLASKAPPWLAKVMGKAPEDRIRFEREESEA
ncbi:MAG: dinitrogenase iron-molybdenum cofactor N-terminal domain-containing protein [Thiohalocapsa sp.]